MKKKITTLVLLSLAFLGSTAFIINYSSGIAGWTGSPGEGYCNNCHGGGSSTSSNITISATPAFSVNEFVPGTTYTITVNVVAAGFSKFGFDCEILDPSNASFGTMQTLGSSAGVYFLSSGFRKNAIHTAPRNGQGAVNFNFKWIAPMTGDSATIFASGNAVNGDGNTTGDFPLLPVLLQLSAQPQQPPPDTSTVGINELKLSPALAASLYPNPAGDFTSLSYMLGSNQHVSVQLIDMYGKTVKEFIDEKETPGAHSHLLDIQAITGGIYFVRLSSSGTRLFQQMLIVK